MRALPRRSTSAKVSVASNAIVLVVAALLWAGVAGAGVVCGRPRQAGRGSRQAVERPLVQWGIWGTAVSLRLGLLFWLMVAKEPLG